MAAFLLPLPKSLDWIQGCLFIYGLSAVLFGGVAALLRHFDVRALRALARGEDILARWRVEATAWVEFAALERGWNRGGGYLPNELSVSASGLENGVEVIMGKAAIQIGDSVHRLSSGVPEITAAVLHDGRPAVIELQLYYPGGGYGASGVPQSARRSVLRFPVARGYWKEAALVVAHYNRDSPQKPGFWHGKGDGSNPEDLSKCYSCGFETYKLRSHCPQCGHSLQSKRWSRRYGCILLVLGSLISVVMGFVLEVALPKLLRPGVTSGGGRFTGSAGEGKLALFVLGAVELFGIVAISYGLWQMVTGRRSKWVIYFVIGFAVVMGLIAIFI